MVQTDEKLIINIFEGKCMVANLKEAINIFFLQRLIVRLNGKINLGFMYKSCNLP